MKLLFLGSGSAFTVGEYNYQSNMLLVNPQNKRLLIDCGSDARLSLHAQGLTHKEITDVYISHLHADHSGGLEWLAFTSKFDPEIPHKPVLHIAETLVDNLWKSVLSGGLHSLEGIIADLNTYFTVKPISNEGLFTWENLKMNTVRTFHVHNGKMLVPSYGLIFKIDGLTCWITTDTQFKPKEMDIYYKKADIIFHDCETASHPSGVHTHYSQLVTLDPEIKSKIWLYHYNPGKLPNAVADGFRGFVRPGQCFDFTDEKTLF